MEKQYFLTPELEVVESIMKIGEKGYLNINWRKGKEDWHYDTSRSFNARVTREGWIYRSESVLKELGLL